MSAGPTSYIQGWVQGSISPKDILECHFGRYKEILDASGKPVLDANGRATFDEHNFDGRIPREMTKRRPVVVVGNHNGCYLVVPISTTEERTANPRKSGVARGRHIVLQPGDMPVTHRYGATTPRWAKADMIQAVSRRRLTSIYCENVKQYVSARMTDRTFELVQHGVIHSIGLSGLLQR